MVMSCYNGVAFNVVLRQSFVLMAHCELTRNVQTKVAQSIADTKLAPANQIWFLKIDNSSRFVRMLAGIRKIAGPFNVHTTHTQFMLWTVNLGTLMRPPGTHSVLMYCTL